MKIPTELHEQILAQVAKGLSQPQIAKWLKADHGVAVSRQAIAKLVNKTRAFRAEASKLAVAEYTAKKLPEDLTIHDGHVARAHEILERVEQLALATPTPATLEMHSKASASYQRYHEQKQRALGLETPSPVVTTLSQLFAQKPDTE